MVAEVLREKALTRISTTDQIQLIPSGLESIASFNALDKYGLKGG